MRIHDDLTKPVLVRSNELDWIPSPSPGVDRRMLYRIGGEVARATSIVRYAPGSAFPRHRHDGGEELLVLEGVFQDEHGDYPAGTYFRNPPDTSHMPAAADGCTIFVRLWQFRTGDQKQIVHRPPADPNVVAPSSASSARVLFDDRHEEVRIDTWSANTRMTIGNAAGIEFLVLKGILDLGLLGRADAGTWGRLPPGNDLVAIAGATGAEIWIKLAPLEHPDVLPLPPAR